MLNRYKYAAVKRRKQLYYACQSILRTKYGMYDPKRHHREKRAFNVIGIASGALTGGSMGYGIGNWAADKFGLDENDWRAKALRWGGGALGAIGGGIAGNFGVPWLLKGLGWAGKALKGANIGGKAMNLGGKALSAMGKFFTGGKNVANAAKTVNTAKNVANTAKTVNTAKNVANTAKTVENTAANANKGKGWLQRGLDFASDMMSSPQNTDPGDYNSQLAGSDYGGDQGNMQMQMQQQNQQIQEQNQQLQEQNQTLAQMMQQFNAIKAKTASYKYARLNRLSTLFAACKGIYRVKSAGFLKDFSKDVGGTLLNNAVGMYSRKIDPTKEGIANQMNDSAYMNALAAIQNGTYDGSYDAYNAIKGSDIRSTDLRSGYQSKAREIATAQNSGQGVTVNNNMPQQQQGGGGGQQYQMQQQQQPGLADYMREYAFNRYKTQ